MGLLVAPQETQERRRQRDLARAEVRKSLHDEPSATRHSPKNHQTPVTPFFHRRPRRRWFLTIAVMVAASGCGGGSSAPTTGSGTSAVFGIRACDCRFADRELVDVGGYHLFLHCEGTGSPVVVFENGFIGFQSDWDTVRQSSEGCRGRVRMTVPATVAAIQRPAVGCRLATLSMTL